MAISIHACLRPPTLLPALPPPSPPSPSPTLISPWSQKTEVSWRSRCVSTAACVLIGSAIGLGGDGEVLAGEVGAEAVGSGAGKIVRWSDKRRCPPWRANSLENIVPEDLPRPSGGQGSNKFAAFGEHVTAPPVGLGPGSIRFRSGCFTL